MFKKATYCIKSIEIKETLNFQFLRKNTKSQHIRMATGKDILPLI